MTSANRSNFKMSSQGDDFEDNFDISDHAQGPQVGGNSDFFHGDEQHGAVAQNLVETMERIIDDRLEKSQNQSNAFIFRRKGNEKQFELNDRIKRRLTLVNRHLSSIKDKSSEGHVRLAAKRAREEVSTIMEDVSHRNKLIKLADLSDGGWATVTEYETHQLADDSDDERRIVKAEGRAMRRIRDLQKRRQDKKRVTSTVVQADSRQINTSSTRRGVCFACGKPGHWRFECTAVRSRSETLSPPGLGTGSSALPNKISTCTTTD